MAEVKVRTVVFFEDHFHRFFEQLDSKSQQKVLWTLRLMETNTVLTREHFKPIAGVPGLFEIRISIGGNAYRIFAVLSKMKELVLLNGFQKKTAKTPRQEIVLAQKIKKLYFDEKE
jgi:phage-related protein